MESNVTLIRNLIKENKTYKHVSEILRQSFPEVTRGFSERNVRLFCAKYGISGFHRSGLRERNKLVFVFVFFVSVCVNRGVPFLSRSLSPPQTTSRNTFSKGPT